jgi:hypothetical protein
MNPALENSGICVTSIRGYEPCFSQEDRISTQTRLCNGSGAFCGVFKPTTRFLIFGLSEEHASCSNVGEEELNEN